MIIKHGRTIVLWAMLLAVTSAGAQTKQITIDECYTLATENYPLAKKHSLIEKSRLYSMQNASRLYLPQLSVNGQASYQSQTLDFSEVLPAAPGFSLPQFSNYQYRMQAEITQPIYDGGVAKNQKESILANEEVQQQSLEVNLNMLKDRVNEIYFSVLLISEQIGQNGLRRSDLQNAVAKAQAKFDNGTGFKSDVDELKAELVNVGMSTTEFKANRKAYLDMLSLLTDLVIDENTQLVFPSPPDALTEIKRPELKLYELEKKNIDIQEKQLRSGYRPKLNAFIQGAYGRPTLNIIENKFGAWWIGGLRLNWSLGSLYTLKNNRALLETKRQNLDIEKETFLFNTNQTLSRENAEIKKYQDLIEQDDTAILLRASVVQSAKAQLDNGVITVHEYIVRLNAENLAKHTGILHHIRLLQAQYNYKTTSGN